MSKPSRRRFIIELPKDHDEPTIICIELYKGQIRFPGDIKVEKLDGEVILSREDAEKILSFLKGILPYDDLVLPQYALLLNRITLLEEAMKESI